jgi:class 3 adenylate cyclase/tetratricopeptide (TPR) repeat protein
MQQIADWLKELGMSEYAQRFAENDIAFDILPDLTDQDLEELGLSLGHRRRMLKAIRELGDPALVTLQTATPASPDSRLGAERRQLTVMFCDLAGSTAPSASLDPEDLRGIITAYHRCCTELVERNGGFVARCMGDRVLAYFGYPRPHEHDAERAVRAGLALAEAVQKLETAAGVPLQVRIGIATGLVVVGDLIGTGAAQEQAVVGETPNLAARLQALAEPGAVVIAPSTRQLIGGLFEYRDLGTVALEGFAENVPAWQVRGASAIESRFEAMRTAMTPLVGREEEINLLIRRWELAKRRDGQVVLISGEPGIGKSRIAHTIMERLSNEAHTRLRYFCSPHHQDSALYPTIMQLQRAAGFHRDDTDEQRLDKLVAVLAEATNDLSEVAPLLADLLSVPTDGRYPPLSFTPQKRKEKTLRALLAQFEGLAAHRPVLTVYEDAHWIDPTSLELLDLTVDRVMALPVLLLITFRPEFAPRWIGRPHVKLVRLGGLLRRQRPQMITRVTGGKPVPKEIADQIIDRTDGVPLFIEELTKTVVESGLLVDAGDRYTVTGPLLPLAIPATLNASLLARLDRLAPVREVAQIGAVLGRRFSHELISAVATMPQSELDDALAQLVSTELMFRRGTPPDAEYTFKHSLVQDAAYGTLLRSRRQQLHARIAATLEKQFSEILETQPELLARHCAEAGLLEKAIEYWRKAGRLAIARGAMTEAVAQIQKSLDLLPGVSDSTACQELELDLQIPLGHALIATKGYAAPEPGEAFARARQLCKQLNRPTELGPVLYGQWLFRLIRGNLERAEHHAEEIRDFGEAQNDVMWKCFGLFSTGHTCFFLGRFLGARTYFENAFRLWDPKYRAFAPSPNDPCVSALIHFSRTLLCLGYVDQARLCRDEALAEARRLSPYVLTWALSSAWYGNWAIEGICSLQPMMQTAEEILAISSEQGFPLFSSVGNIIRGWCISAMGQALEGIPLILQGVASRRSTGANTHLPFFLATLAEIYGMAGQPAEGLNCLTQATQEVETTQERWAEAEIHRLRGTMLLSMREHAAAEESYQHALAVARRQTARFWELRAATNLARLWLHQGKQTEARDLLAPVYGWFTEGFDTPVLQDAKALLDELA